MAGATRSVDGDVTGHIGSGPDGQDGWAVNLTASGTIRWNICVYVNGSDIIYTLTQTTVGDYIIAGITRTLTGNFYAVSGKISDTGGIEWVNTFGGSSGDTWFTSALPEIDGSSVAIGKTNIFTIAPNPANQNLGITAYGKIASVTINNILGQQVFSGKYETQNVTIDVSSLPCGMYFVKINNEQTGRFLKE